MKGILLAGGSGTRLYPLTRAITKQLLPVYDKPLIYYPLSILMLSGIKDIMLITSAGEQERFKNVLGDGRQLGIKITYAVQNKPRGIAEALLIAEKFIGGDHFCLVLGDNIFFGDGLSRILQETVSSKENVIFGYYVKDPERYGIVEFDKNNRIVSLEEKPTKPKSHYAVPGLYFYGPEAVGIARKLKPSRRGEIEITDINKELLKQDRLTLKVFSRGYAWLDTGTYDALLSAAMFVKTIEDRQGLKIGCIEEIAWRMGYISAAQLKKIAGQINTSYGDYLKEMVR